MASYVLEGPKWGAAPFGAGGGTVYWSFADPANGHRFYDWDASITGEFQTEVEHAFSRWQSVADLQFVEVTDSSSVNIRLGFDAIDGVGGTAGQTGYIYGSDNRFQAAEIRFDSNEGWRLQGGAETSPQNLSFFVLALHEIGHAIGLGHYNVEPAVMNSVLTSSITDLTQSDKDGIAALYGDTTPPIEPQSTLPVAVGGMATLSTAFLLSTDNLSGPAGLRYAVVEVPRYGTLLLNGNPTSSFTQADIDAGRVQYRQDGAAATEDGFTFTVADEAGNWIGPEPFTIAILDTTDPVVFENNAATVSSGGGLPIWKDALSTVALGSDPAEMVYTILATPAHGALVVNGQPVSSFTQADIDNGLLNHIQPGGAAESDGFSFVVTDSTGKQTAPQTFRILIPGQTAPTPVGQDAIITDPSWTASAIMVDNSDAQAALREPETFAFADIGIPIASLDTSLGWSDDPGTMEGGDAVPTTFLELVPSSVDGDGIGSS
jgi:hypothetical protein